MPFYKKTKSNEYKGIYKSTGANGKCIQGQWIRFLCVRGPSSNLQTKKI